VDEHIAAIIVAAGQASRFGAPKILTPVSGVPAVIHSLRAVAAVPEISSTVLVINPDLHTAIETHLEGSGSPRSLTIVPGGVRRQDSVKAGLDASGGAEIVVIHDGARPLVTPALFQATIAAIRDGADAAITALPVTDTIKRRSKEGIQTVDRTDLFRAQTPQAFRVSALRRGFDEAARRHLEVTDESTLVEMTGGKIALIPGDERNLKLTTQEDAQVLDALSRIAGDRVNVVRTGIGYDVHRLVAGRRLVLGGVVIPFELGLEGLSDADVLLHAIADAILGACALGDIGLHFPPGEEAFRNVSSLTLLERVQVLASAAGNQIVNVDATVIAEAPKLSPHREAMRAAIAAALRTPESAISIKATTNEGLGFAGRQEGIAAMAVATVRGPI
jgi:2-C-methyl-D-erythritol 4-phosphate cytidylyltransferase/2-C-methyl-D-erythritol 2,4-cyclodiphosphate synthase